MWVATQPNRWLVQHCPEVKHSCGQQYNIVILYSHVVFAHMLSQTFVYVIYDKLEAASGWKERQKLSQVDMI